MKKEKILQLLCDVIEKDIAQVSYLPGNTQINEIGLDSIRFVQFIVKMEEEFNIEINDSDLLLSKFRTIDDIFQMMQKYFVVNPLRKVLILDCDNVLWNGVAGEEPLIVNEHILSFQNLLIQLYHQGVLLCLCSKNQEQNIHDAFLTLSMPLTIDHFVLSKISFTDKAQNIKEISTELNLSVESFVFADDSDYECGLIQQLLPEVQTIKVDYSNLYFITHIKELFDGERTKDLNRTTLYKEQKEREKAKKTCSSVEEYSRSLETKFHCEEAKNDQAMRLSELSLRTNQFNLSGKRYTKQEIEQLQKNDHYLILALFASDKYGDMGMVGAAIVRRERDYTIIENFLISCRVFERGFENILLDKIKQYSKDRCLYGIFVCNEKNIRYQDFYPKNGVLFYEDV